VARLTLRLAVRLAPALAAPAALGAQAAATPTVRPPDAAFVALRADAGPPLDARVTVNATNVPLARVVDDLARQAGLTIVFDPTLPGLDRPVTLRLARTTVAAAIVRLTERTPVRAVISPTGGIVLVARPASSREGPVGGAVRDSLAGTPLAGARVELLGTRFATATREDGRFAFPAVPAGEYQLRIAQLGYRPLVLGALRVGEGALAPLDVRLARAPTPLGAVLVTPGYYGVIESAGATRLTMSRTQIQAAPQIGEDIFRAVSRLPGIAANEFSAGFAVRGFGPEELYVSLDGLELTEPYHLKDIAGGALSILDVDAVGGVELTTGGFSAEYGDRLGGVFSMRSVDPRRDRTRTALGISVMNARASSQGGFAHGRGGWLVSARRGYLDLALRLTQQNDSIKPRYYDAFAKVDYDLPGGGRISAHLLGARDAMTFRDQAEGTLLSRYGSGYGWVTWESADRARLRQRTVASLGHLTWLRDIDDVGYNAFGHRVPTGAVDDRRAFTALGLRQDWAFDVGSRALLKWGVDVRRESADYDYVRWGLRESVADPGEIVSRRDTVTALLGEEGTRLGAYVAHRLRPVEGLAVEVGLRHDRATASHDAVTSPRLNVSWQPRAGTTVRGAWGRYSQSQSLFSIQAEDGETALARAERSEQRVLGVEQALPRGLTARVEAYDHRVSPRRARWVNVGGTLDIPPETDWDRVLIAPDRGHARGVELLVSRDARGRVDWSVSYALASATDRVAGRDVARVSDQRHTLHLDWSYHPPSDRWRLSTSAVWYSGRPYTPQLVEIDTVANTPQQFWIITPRWYAGELSTGRLPNYHRVDARWTRYFDTRRGRVSLFAEVFNLLNTKNIGKYYTNVNVIRREVRLVPGWDTMISRLPTAGIAWEF
jgi:hypothetical protein